MLLKRNVIKALEAIESLVMGEESNIKNSKYSIPESKIREFNIRAFSVLSGGELASNDCGTTVKLRKHNSLPSLEEKLRLDCLVGRWLQALKVNVQQQEVSAPVVSTDNIVDPDAGSASAQPQAASLLSSVKTRADFAKSLEQLLVKQLTVADMSAILECAIRVRKREWTKFGIFVGITVVVLAGGYVAVQLYNDRNNSDCSDCDGNNIPDDDLEIPEVDIDDVESIDDLDVSIEALEKCAIENGCKVVHF